MKWLLDAHLHVLGADILWREIIGNVFGLASAIGGMRRRVWAWPVGIVGNLLLFSVFFGVAITDPEYETLYGQAARQVFFIAVSLYGWWRWNRNRHRDANAPAVVPRWATGRERATYLSVALVSVLVCWAIFRAVGADWPAPWWYFLADSWIFVGSVLATYAMARGWVDFWLCWLAVDLVGVPELIYFRYYPSALLYGVYAGFVIWGFVVWLRVARAEQRTPTAGAPKPDEMPV